MRTLLSFLQRLVQVDVRSLVALRIGVGVLILWDLAIRLPNLTAHYTDAGLLPRAALFEKLGRREHFSLYFLNGTTTTALVLFIIAACLAVALIAGYRTRLATFLSWIMMMSLHARNPGVLNAGDTLLRLLLFWGMFVPWGEWGSYDAKRPNRVSMPTSKSLVTWGTAALVLQVCIMYWVSAVQKTGREWIPDGTAVYYALQLDSMRTPLGAWLVQFGEFLRISTYATWGWEMFGPFLLLAPWASLRFFAVVAFWLMHIGFFLCLEIGLFPWVNCVALLAFVPGDVWDRFGRWLPFNRAMASGFSQHRWYASPVCNALVAVLLGCVLVWNIAEVRKKTAVPQPLASFGRILRFDQQWDMFAPKPMLNDGWIVIEGKLNDGKTVDVFHEAIMPVSWAKPKYVASEFGSYRWRKYLMNLRTTRYRDYRLHYGRYLCRSWNIDEPIEDRRLHTFQMYFMREVTPAPDKAHAKVDRVLLWNHNCYKKPGSEPARPPRDSYASARRMHRSPLQPVPPPSDAVSESDDELEVRDEFGEANALGEQPIEAELESETNQSTDAL